MINLETKNKEQEIIKQYLEENASETLIEKINNGVKIVKNNKTLINKKNLETFWTYAYEEAKKLRQNNENVLGVADNIVFSWAMHYFEEDSIEGKLYHEDGSEYKVKTEIKIITTPKPQPKKQSLSREQQQMLFDIFDDPMDDTVEDTPEVQIEEQIITPNIDIETGEVLNIQPNTQNEDNELINILNKLLDNKLEVML